MAERQDIMLCYQYDEKRLKRYGRPWYVQPKVEGDRCRAIINHNGVQLLSSSAKDRNFSVPHIAKQLKVPITLELDGELYVPGMLHEDIRSIVSRTELRHPDYQIMQYHIFDLVDDTPQFARFDELDVFFSEFRFSSIVQVPTYRCGTTDEIEMYYEDFVGQGYEGIIIRDGKAPYIRKKTTTMMKLKPRETMLCVIKGAFEEISIDGKPKGNLGGFEVINTQEIEFRVGTGFTRKQREEWWPLPEELYGAVIRIAYQSLTTNNVPKMAAFKEVI